MGGYEVIGVTSVPSFNNSLVNKKYVDDEVLAVSGGINQTQADARYVRKTKTTIGGEWTDVFSDMSFADYNWSRYVKKDTLNSDSNIETRVASFVTDMSLSQLLKHKLVLGVRYVSSSSAVVKQLETITLSGKSYKNLVMDLLEIISICTHFTFTTSIILEMTLTRKILSYGSLERNLRPRKSCSFRHDGVCLVCFERSWSIRIS